LELKLPILWATMITIWRIGSRLASPLHISIFFIIIIISL
jgi:hypothetical protein